MIKSEKIRQLRQKLTTGQPSVGSWMQFSDPNLAEVLGRAGYEWIAVDLEHGCTNSSNLPNIFRALELGGTLPFARVAYPSERDCRLALEAGAAGLIIPMVRDFVSLRNLIANCQMPPTGKRGVGYARANLYGKDMLETIQNEEFQRPFIVAMIENEEAFNELDQIVQLQGLDCVFVGPYDLSASMGIVGDFSHHKFTQALETTLAISAKHNKPCGIHVVDCNPDEIQQRISEGYRLIAYSMDSVFLQKNCVCPKFSNQQK